MSLFDLDAKKIPIFGSLFQWLHTEGMDYGLFVTILIVVVAFIAFSTSPVLASSSISFFFKLAPIWLPLFIFYIAFARWMDYVHKRFAIKQGRTTLRIILPQEVQKSPEAMEFVLNQIWNKQTPDNLWQTYIDGKFPLATSLEMVSIGGDVRFYVNIHTIKGKDIFLSNIYAQYPGVEVIEEPVDYAGEIPVGDPNWDVFSVQLAKKDAKWAPIKTYIDFGLDKMPKEEEKVDPMTPLLERLGSISPNERIYIQLILRTASKGSFKTGLLQFGETPDWSKQGQAHIAELMQRDPETKAPKTPEGSDFDGAPRITPGERSTIEAIERNISKYAYKVGIRYLYMAKKGHFNSDNLTALNRVFTQFDVVGRGAISAKWRTDFNYKWFSDPFGERLKALKEQEHREYKMRLYFQKDPSNTTSIMTTEEIATIFHLPGKVALTPTLGRIPSTRSQAPSNLPVGEVNQI